jgi:hypothetical protein
MYICIHRFCAKKKAESLLTVKGREVSGGKNGLLHMGAFNIRCGDKI